MAKQIASLAKQKYGGQVSIAVRDPEVRNMLMLYSQSTGQKMPLSATTPHGASLVEQNGQLFQAPGFVNGQAYTFPSSLPVAGNYATNNYPSQGGTGTVILNINGQSAADLLEGRIANTVDSGYVQARWSSAVAASNGRIANAGALLAPNLVVM